MKVEPIIIVAGEPNSVFLEIFFKSLKNHKYRSPLIIIVSKKLLQEQMKKLGFNFKINTIDKNFNAFKKLNNKNINLIDVKYKFNDCFEKISNKSNNYVEETFKIALRF
jgi:4-hydroxy-L-threonine phosphate dehydrogenase PdxA